MIVLLDTHCWVWWISTPTRLNDTARALIADRRNTVYFSAASAWEIAIKYALRKLRLPESPETFIPSRLERDGFTALPILLPHALQVTTLPHHHRDPFDRILIAQAQVENIPLLTADPQLKAYTAQLLWAV